MLHNMRKDEWKEIDAREVDMRGPSSHAQAESSVPPSVLPKAFLAPVRTSTSTSTQRGPQAMRSAPPEMAPSARDALRNLFPDGTFPDTFSGQNTHWQTSPPE